MGDFILETVEKEHNRMALNVAALAGDILLASGAEIFRVEETINRIAHAYGIDSCDPFVLSSGFFLTADSNSRGQRMLLLSLRRRSGRLYRGFYRRTAAVCLSAVRGERTAFQNRNEYIRWHVCDFHRRPDLSVGTWTSSE